MVGCLLLDRVFRLHVQFACHLVAVIGKQIVVQRLLVTCYRTSDTRGMCSKYGSDLGQMRLNVECAQTAHPLVSVVNHALAFVQVVVVVTLHH